MNRLSEGWQVGALVGCAVLAASAPHALAKPRAPADPRPDVVGQVISEGRTETLPVVILRGGKSVGKVKNYALLLPGDRLYVKDKAARVEVQIYGGDSTTLDGRLHGGPSNPYEVPEAPHRVGWNAKGVGSLLLLFPKLFDMPGNRPALLTTPNGPKGAEAAALSPLKLLPASPQTLKVGQGKVLVPVAWSGGPALVRLARECRLAVVEQISTLPGFVELHASNLVEDDYCIEVWPVDGTGAADPKAGFSIPIKVTVEEPAAIDEQTAVLAAATALRGPAPGRLQGLVDLDRQAQTSFKAWLVLRSVAEGQEAERADAGADAAPEPKPKPKPDARRHHHKHSRRH